MKKLTLAAVLLAASMSVFGQQEIQRPALCAHPKEVAEVLEKAGEQPVWAGTDTETGINYALTVNLTTKAWTFVEFLNDKIACVLAMGDKSMPLPVKSKGKPV